MIEHEIQPGDCVTSLAHQYGLLWETIWDHPANAALRQKRPNPNVLQPGDILNVPEREIKELSKATEQRHKFVLKSNRAKLRLKLVDYKHRPLRNLAYRLTIDGVVQNGSSDGNGMLEHPIPPGAQAGEIRYTVDGKEVVRRLALGHVDPIDTLKGVRERLANLGHACPANDGPLDDQARDAIREFQKKHRLAVNGQPDDATRAKLLDVHGC